MKFENLFYSKTINFEKLEMPFGIYYLCENFFIGELQEGIHFDWIKAEMLFKKLIHFYSNCSNVGFISNRINDYSVDPTNWTKVEKKYDFITAGAIVIYNSSTLMNASIEKKFTKKSIKRCTSLKEAINWMKDLKEFNQNSNTLPSSHNSTLLKTS